MERKSRILVVDDDEGSRLALSTLINDEGYEVETARNGADALQCIHDREIDLVVSDVQMPGIGGFEVVRKLRQSAKSRDIPVILVSGQANPDRRTTGLKLGADDFMVKPLDFAELHARIQTQLRHWRRHRELRHELLHDPLTSTLNRRGILEFLVATLRDAPKQESYTTVLMIDLNDFKKVNDTRGHAAGDAVLRSVANHLLGALRSGDKVGRLGGDEFLVVLPSTNTDDARVPVERLRDCSSAASLAVGVATARGAELADVLIRRADEAMYEDKRRRKLAGGSPASIATGTDAETTYPCESLRQGR